MSTHDPTRRSLLVKLTAGVLGAGFLGTLWPYVRSLVPNVLYEPSARFKIGDPGSYPEGVQFIEDRRIYVFREGNGFRVISGVCTHLGCTVKFVAFGEEREMTVRGSTYVSRGEFLCPCHGSKFRDEGTNYSGPAPRPLTWHKLEISPEDGQLVVDLATDVDRDFRLVV